MKWKPIEDKFIFSLQDVVETALNYQGSITKRNMVKITASHYDPPGILSPILIRFKFLVQEACQQKLSWDTEINEGLAEKWNKLLHDCAKLAPFIIHHNYIHGQKLSDVTEVELHGFSDASGKAYACIIYLRVLFKNGDILTTFVASKSRVAPIKHVLIPRLELMACLILVRLMTVTLKSLADYVIDRVFCWSDSTDCLFWIDHREKLWCRFVQNRVSEIRERLPNAKWRFCPGEKNPG